MKKSLQVTLLVLILCVFTCELYGQNVGAKFSAEPSPLYFNLTGIGASDSKEIKVTNAGSEDLLISGVYVTGKNIQDFVFASGKIPVTIEPGNSVVFTFKFEPKGIGIRVATANFVSTDSDSPNSVDLTGIGKKAEKKKPVETKPVETKPSETQPKQTQTQTQTQTLIQTQTQTQTKIKVPSKRKRKRKKPVSTKKYRFNYLVGPLSFMHLNGLHSLAGYSRMECTATVPETCFYAGTGFSLASHSEYGGDPNFDATIGLVEFNFKYGIIDSFEAGLRFRTGGWNGTIVAPGLSIDFKGGLSIGDMFLDLKYNFLKESSELPYAFSSMLSAKFPTGSQDNVLSSGGIDFSLVALNSVFLLDHKLGLHLMLGFTYAMEASQLDTSNLLWDLLLNFGGGVSFAFVMESKFKASVTAQVEFYDPNLDATLGFRGDIVLGNITLMPAIGFTYGIHEMSADYTIQISLALLF